MATRLANPVYHTHLAELFRRRQHCKAEDRDARPQCHLAGIEGPGKPSQGFSPVARFLSVVNQSHSARNVSAKFVTRRAPDPANALRAALVRRLPRNRGELGRTTTASGRLSASAVVPEGEGHYRACRAPRKRSRAAKTTGSTRVGAWPMPGTRTSSPRGKLSTMRRAWASERTSLSLPHTTRVGQASACSAGHSGGRAGGPRSTRCRI